MTNNSNTEIPALPLAINYDGSVTAGSTPSYATTAVTVANMALPTVTGFTNANVFPGYS